MKFNAYKLVIFFIALMLGATGAMAQNKWYPVNTSPLKQTKFVLLPLTTVKPDGWLLRQLQVMASGSSGHVLALTPTNPEDPGFPGVFQNDGSFFHGYIPLAYLTNDQRLIADVENTWVPRIIANRNAYFTGQTGDGMFNPMWWWQALRYWFEARGERASDTAVFNSITRQYMQCLTTCTNSNAWGTSWARNIGHESQLALLWWYRRSHDASIPALSAAIKNRVLNWAPVFQTMTCLNAGDDIRNASGWNDNCHHGVLFGHAYKFASLLWQFPAATAADSQASYLAIDKMARYHGQVAAAHSGDEAIAGPKDAPAPGTTPGESAPPAPPPAG